MAIVVGRQPSPYDISGGLARGFGTALGFAELKDRRSQNAIANALAKRQLDLSEMDLGYKKQDIAIRKQLAENQDLLFQSENPAYALKTAEKRLAELDAQDIQRFKDVPGGMATMEQRSSLRNQEFGAEREKLRQQLMQDREDAQEKLNLVAKQNQLNYMSTVMNLSSDWLKDFFTGGGSVKSLPTSIEKLAASSNPVQQEIGQALSMIEIDDSLSSKIKDAADNGRVDVIPYYVLAQGVDKGLYDSEQVADMAMIIARDGLGTGRGGSSSNVSRIVSEAMKQFTDFDIGIAGSVLRPADLEKVVNDRNERLGQFITDQLGSGYDVTLSNFIYAQLKASGEMDRPEPIGIFAQVRQQREEQARQQQEEAANAAKRKETATQQAIEYGQLKGDAKQLANKVLTNAANHDPDKVLDFITVVSKLPPDLLSQVSSALNTPGVTLEDILETSEIQPYVTWINSGAK